MAPPPFQLQASAPVQMAKQNATVGKKKKYPKGGIRKPPTKRNSYSIWHHGAKTREQKRLQKLYGVTVSGKTHESEHTIGYEVLARTAGGKRGGNVRNKNLENFAPAYQEEYRHHRANIGTSTKKKIAENGFNSYSYRDTQRNALLNGDVSTPVQINQLTYAFQDGFERSGSKREKQSNSSFHSMVQNMDKVTFAVDDENHDIKVGISDKMEMLVARFSAKNGRYPNNLERWYLEMASRGRNVLGNKEDLFAPRSEMEEMEENGLLPEDDELDDEDNVNMTEKFVEKDMFGKEIE